MSLPNPIAWLRPGIAVLIMCAWATTSGCVTTLGYVPEHLKPENTRDYVPTYAEVKKWAFDVADGYGSRAILNRYAIYKPRSRRATWSSWPISARGKILAGPASSRCRRRQLSISCEPSRARRSSGSPKR